MQCVPCPVGMYVKPAASCGYCKTACPAGSYMSGSCSGLALFDEVECAPCRACDAGQYQWPTCDGRQAVASECRACTVGECPAGYYRGPCSGGLNGACIPCTACAAGKYNKGCGGGTDGVCTPCSVCSAGFDQYRACSALEDTGCKGGACNTSVSCGPLFCNYPTLDISSCDWKWQIGGSNINFLCATSKTQGTCQECPPGWTASGAYCVECKQGSSCDRSGAPKCDGQCSVEKYPTCDVATARTVCMPCAVNQTLLSAGHRRLTRGGVLDAPELCGAYFQCGVGYYMASSASSGAAGFTCEPCSWPEPSQSGFEAVSRGLTFGDKFSCVYRPKAAAAEFNNGVGQYGSPLTSCPAGHTSMPGMAPNISGCVACLSPPVHGGFDPARFDCHAACPEGGAYTQLGESCIKADRSQLICEGMDGYTSPGVLCEPSPLPWSDPGSTADPAGGVRSTVVSGSGLLSSDALSAFAASATTLYNAEGSNLCNMAYATGENLGYVQDKPLFTAVCSDREAHTFYMIVRGGGKFAYAFLERTFGNNNRFVIWQVQVSSGVVGKVWQSWRLPGKVCSAAWSRRAGAVSEHLYLALCGAPFLVYLEAADLSDALADPGTSVVAKGAQQYAIGRQFGVLIGQDSVGKRDGMRDSALFGAYLSVASTADPSRLLVADRDNCRLVEVVMGVPGSFLTRATTVGAASCYSGSTPMPFPRLLTSTLGGAMAIFVTDLGVMQLDSVTRTVQLILRAGEVPVSDPLSIWASADGGSILAINATHAAETRRRQVPCPARHESRRGGGCVPCNEQSYVSKLGRCAACSAPSCALGSQRLVQCNATSDARCEDCAKPAPEPAYPYTFDANCMPMPVPPCPDGYYAAASGAYCSPCPSMWSPSALDGVAEEGRCKCFKDSGAPVAVVNGTCFVGSPFGAEAGPYFLPGWAKGLNCTYQYDQACRSRGCYLQRASPRNCSECADGLYGPYGMWCERCPGFRSPSPAKDSCLCRGPSKIADDGSEACVCPAGHATGGPAGCTPCEVGTFKSGVTVIAEDYLAQGGACLPCPAGMDSDAGSSSCRPCQRGSYRSAAMRRCERCVADTPSSPYYPRDPKTGTSCTPCRAECSTGERWTPCPTNGSAASSMFACEPCDVPLFSTRAWIPGSTNRDCLWGCKSGYYARNGNCWPCTRPACGSGYVFTECGKYDDAHCRVPCANATKPSENSEWGPGCTWRCLAGYAQREKVFAGWTEFACELETLLPWSGWW